MITISYRSIALSSIVDKVLDNIIFTKHAEIFVTSDLQFGSKANHSNRLCTVVLKEVVDFYVEPNSPCYAVLLDASIHNIIRLLITRGIFPNAVKLFVFVYVYQSLIVKLYKTGSGYFNCRNDIKQDGVLSPTLFCVYSVYIIQIVYYCCTMFYITR